MGYTDEETHEMPYEFTMPEKINVILHAMKAVTEMFNGLDSGAKDGELVHETYKHLSYALMTEINGLKIES